MTDLDIQNSKCLSKKLLQDLKKEISEMSELMRQVFVVAHNMEGTWTAIHVTHKNYETWKRELEENT